MATAAGGHERGARQRYSGVLTVHTEVVIVGAGIAGLSLATRLQQHGIDTALIEAAPTITPPADADARVLALTPASAHDLYTLGVWQTIPADRIGYFRTIHVCDENGGGTINFDSAAIGESAMAYTVQQAFVEHALATHSAPPAVRWYQPAAVMAVEQHDDDVSVTLDDGRRVAARLLVAADGASSMVRRLAGIADTYTDYHQHAVACIVQTEQPHRYRAWQKFLRDGPLALLPMAAADRYGVVWSTTGEAAHTLSGLDDRAFCPVLGNATDHHGGAVLHATARAMFPLAGVVAKKMCCPRIALIGEAAHRVHPLAGQGANLALLDAACLAEVVIATRHKQRDIGAHATLRKYERRRAGHNLLMYKTLEGFKYLFENQTPSVARLRNAGMNVLDAWAPVKGAIMRYAMGPGG